MRVTFGEFTFDADRRLLFRGAEPVHLGPKAFDLLLMLLERRPNVVAKSVLMERLWPKTFVAENNLATLVNDVRTAVGDEARESRVIRTAHGVGYAFVADAIEAARVLRPAQDERPLSDWLLVWGQTTLPLVEGENIVGRPAHGVIGIDALTVSRQHARIVTAGDEATVEDLGSKNGSWIGTTRITNARPVRHGDEMRFGTVLVKIVRNARDASTRTAQLEDPPGPQKSSTNS
jgi:DNA-binding winged helix-turn-helix (wHTH) protein